MSSGSPLVVRWESVDDPLGTARSRAKDDDIPFRPQIRSAAQRMVRNVVEGYAAGLKSQPEPALGLGGLPVMHQRDPGRSQRVCGHAGVFV